MTAPRKLAWLRPAELALLVHASLLLVRFRLALGLLPWRRVLALLPTEVTRATRFDVERLEQAIRAASQVIPRATCLTQALALNHLLSRRGHASIVRIGVTNAHGRFAAHAWVECGGVPLLDSAADLARYAQLLAWAPAQPDLLR